MLSMEMRYRGLNLQNFSLLHYQFLHGNTTSEHIFWLTKRPNLYSATSFLFYSSGWALIISPIWTSKLSILQLIGLLLWYFAHLLDRGARNLIRKRKVGAPGFEPGSKAPKAPSIGQTNPCAPIRPARTFGL